MNVLIGDIIDLGRCFWLRDRRQTGLEIDALRGQNIPGNSRTIDRTLVPDGVVSHKSTDLRCKSYRLPRVVYRLGLSFVRELRAYSGEVRRNHSIKATYFLGWAVENADCPRLLEWFVPLNGVTEQQEQALEQVFLEGQAFGITVKIFRVCD